MNEKLTDEEEKAIRALKRLGKKWPQSLLIFGSAGSGLSIRKPDENGSCGHQTEVASIDGFPNDGGDGGDKF
jgi:hypothetical protein